MPSSGICFSENLTVSKFFFLLACPLRRLWPLYYGAATNELARGLEMYLTLWIVALRGVERGREEGFVCVCVSSLLWWYGMLPCDWRNQRTTTKSCKGSLRTRIYTSNPHDNGLSPSNHLFTCGSRSNFKSILGIYHCWLENKIQQMTFLRSIPLEKAVQGLRDSSKLVSTLPIAYSYLLWPQSNLEPVCSPSLVDEV